MLVFKKVMVIRRDRIREFPPDNLLSRRDHWNKLFSNSDIENFPYINRYPSGVGYDWIIVNFTFAPFYISNLISSLPRVAIKKLLSISGIEAQCF